MSYNERESAAWRHYMEQWQERQTAIIKHADTRLKANDFVFSAVLGIPLAIGFTFVGGFILEILYIILSFDHHGIGFFDSIALSFTLLFLGTLTLPLGLLMLQKYSRVRKVQREAEVVLPRPRQSLVPRADYVIPYLRHQLAVERAEFETSTGLDAQLQTLTIELNVLRRLQPKIESHCREQNAPEDVYSDLRRVLVAIDQKEREILAVKEAKAQIDTCYRENERQLAVIAERYAIADHKEEVNRAVARSDEASIQTEVAIEESVSALAARTNELRARLEEHRQDANVSIALAAAGNSGSVALDIRNFEERYDALDRSHR